MRSIAAVALAVAGMLGMAAAASAQGLDPSANAYSVTGPDASPYALARPSGGAQAGYGSDGGRVYGDPYAAASAHGAAPGVGYVDPSLRDPTDPYYFSKDSGWRRGRLGAGQRATSAAISVGSMMMNAVFTPFKIAVGVAGAELGGLAGAMNGGDGEAAAGIWNVTTDGGYFVTPRVLDGREPLFWGSDDD